MRLSMSEYPSAECKSVEFHPCESRVGNLAGHMWYRYLSIPLHPVPLMFCLSPLLIAFDDTCWFPLNTVNHLLLYFSSFFIILFVSKVLACWVWFIVLTPAPLCFYQSCAAEHDLHQKIRLDRRVGSDLENLYFHVNVKKHVKWIVEFLEIHCAGLRLLF